MTVSAVACSSVTVVSAVACSSVKVTVSAVTSCSSVHQSDRCQSSLSSYLLVFIFLFPWTSVAQHSTGNILAVHIRNWGPRKHAVRSTQHAAHNTQLTAHRTQQAAHCTHHTRQRTQHTAHSTEQVAHSTHHTVRSTYRCSHHTVRSPQSAARSPQPAARSKHRTTQHCRDASSRRLALMQLGSRYRRLFTCNARYSLATAVLRYSFSVLHYRYTVLVYSATPVLQPFFDDVTAIIN